MTKPMNVRICAIVIFLSASIAVSNAVAQDAASSPTIFAKDNLVAWCIVPFDAKQRGPAERAKMVKRLGLHRVAYDWRQEHVATFEEEIAAYKSQGIEYFAFWSWHDKIEPLILKHGIKPQIWITAQAPETGSQQERVKAAARSLQPHVRKTKQLGLQLGLYNHGGWGGEPENLVAICKELREQHDSNHIGIVYNFHHGHGHIDDFAEALHAMQPYLLCLNINGMADPTTVDVRTQENKILPVGSGQHEQKMLQTVIESGYDGPIGILGHRKDIDVEVALGLNLDGLSNLFK